MTPTDSHYTSFELAQGRGDTPTTPTNEAAERLHQWITNAQGNEGRGRVGHGLADAALAAERRATVERIRKGLLPQGGRAYYSEPWQRMLADRLDDEAAR